MKDRASEKARLDAVRAERRLVIEKIWQSERSIKLSQERLKRLDELLLSARKTQPREWRQRH
jgi:hypothetical protein